MEPSDVTPRKLTLEERIYPTRLENEVKPVSLDEQLRMDISQTEPSEVTPRKLTLAERIHPTRLENEVKPGSDGQMERTRSGMRVRPTVPDISDEQTEDDHKLSTDPEPPPSLSGSVTRLKHMFETLTQSPSATITSSSLDKPDDLPSLKVKDIAVKFSANFDDDFFRSSGAVNDALENEFRAHSNDRTKEQDQALEVLNSTLNEEEQKVEITRGTQQENYFSPATNTPIGNPKSKTSENEGNVNKDDQVNLESNSEEKNAKQHVPKHDVSPVSEDSTASGERIDICDELRYDSEFLFENDQITEESLRKSSEPELIRRGTLTSQFLFGWKEPENGAEEIRESSEISLNNDLIHVNRLQKISKGENGAEGDVNTTEKEAANSQIQSCPTEETLPKVFKSDDRELVTDKVSDVEKHQNQESIFISADFAQSTTAADYTIPLMRSTKLEPDLIPESISPTVESEPPEQSTTATSGFQIHIPETGLELPLTAESKNPTCKGEMLSTVKEAMLVPVISNVNSSAPNFPESESCDITEDIGTLRGKHIDNKAICDNVENIGTKEATVIDSKPDQSNSVSSGVVSGVLPDVVPSSASNTTEIKPSSELALHAEISDLYLVQKSDHKNVTYNISDKRQQALEGQGREEDDDSSGTDSEDSDTVAENDELATQSSLLDMYQTLLHNPDEPPQQKDSESDGSSFSGSSDGSSGDEEGVFDGTVKPVDPGTLRPLSPGAVLMRRASLTNTLRENIDTLTPGGFQSLMASFRDPSSPVTKLVGGTVTLEPKNQAPDGQVRFDETYSVDQDVGPSASGDQGVGSSINTDTFTQTNALLKDMSDIDKVFMETATQSGPLVRGDEVKELLERHLAEVDVLSKLRAREKDRLQQKLQEKLAQRDKQKNTQSTAEHDGEEEEVLRMEEVHAAVLDKLERKLNADLQELNQKCVKKLSTVRDGELSAEMLQTLLAEHRTQQANLIAQRLTERDRQNQLLTKRLQQGHRIMQASMSSKTSSTLSSTDSSTSFTSDSNRANEMSGTIDTLSTVCTGGARDTVDIDRRVAEMDSEFYRSLMERQEREGIGEEELEHLVEGHLDRVDEFRTRLEDMVRRKRTERREMMKGRRKKSHKSRARDELSVTGLLKERSEVDKQVQELRQQHRQVSDYKLQQILKAKQKVKDSTNLDDTLSPST